MAVLLGIAVAAASPWSWCTQTSIIDYQVDLGPPPTTVADALNSRVAREHIALQAIACGQEIGFLRDVLKGDNGEDLVKVLVAKVGWLRQGEGRCIAHVAIRMSDAFDRKALEASFAERYGCSASPITEEKLDQPISDIAEVEEASAPLAARRLRTLTFEIDDACMKQQVNKVIVALQRNDRVLGTAEPCHVVGTVKGDWDVTVRDLVRIYYLSKDPAAVAGGKILDDATREHIFNDLFNLSGAPWPDSYPLSGCGNTEDDGGSPQDRADERSWAEDNFEWLGDLWDTFKWFLIFLVILLVIVLAVALALAILFYLLGAGAAFSLAAVAVAALGTLVIVAGILAPLIRIPETENHLLMINTSRYFVNEILIDANPTDVEFFVDDQKKVVDWLLKYLQRIVTHDFDEYNARPYQRYSIVALLNLRDFTRCSRVSAATQGCALKAAATIVLDLATAKFALASNEGRRSVPFRRLMSVVIDDVMDSHRFTDASAASDFMFGFTLGYFGHTSQLPDHKAENGAVVEMMYAATSTYIPPPAVMSIALGEVGPYEQTIRHGGYEMFSRSPSFLVSAGGVRTPSATPLKLGPFSLGERCIDRGAALPTVLIPSGAAYRVPDGTRTGAAVVREDLLRIVGFYFHYGNTDGSQCLVPSDSHENAPPSLTPRPKDERDRTWSQDYNLCVYKGFACGTNIVVPPGLEACFTPADSTPWRFLTSVGCQAMPNAKPFFVAMFSKPCPSKADNCLTNWGFFEAVEASKADCDPAGSLCFLSWGAVKAPFIGDVAAAYAAFQAKVRATNGETELPDPPSGVDDPALAGRYFSPTGHSVEFDAAATMNDKNKPGVGSVDNIAKPNLGAWPLASGTLINSSKCPSNDDLAGKIEISGKNNGVTIDFCDIVKPMRTLH